MEIIGKIEIEGFLRVMDLDDGDVFTFLDDNKPYMLCSDACSDYIINLSTGYVEEEDSTYSNRPIRKLKAKLIIEE